MAEALELRSPYTPMSPTWLFEGTFEDWLSKTYPNLELSNKVRPSRYCPMLIPSTQRANKRQVNSTQAASDILNEVWCDFLRRQDLPSKKCLRVPDLLHILRIHCTEFRLLDLPLEMRETIYGMVFEEVHNPKDCGCEKCRRIFNCSSVTVVDSYATSYDAPLRRIGNPTLLHVSRQVRSEAGKVYYRSKQFHLFSDCINPEREVNTWLQTMVGEFSTHLRDLTVHLANELEGPEPEFARIRAQYRPGHGLKITGSVDKVNDDIDSDGWLKTNPLPFVGMPKYVARLEKVRVAYKEQGEIIVNFFSH